MKRMPQSWATGAPVPQVFLLPGTLHCSAEPTLVTTVLGSCVAVCLSDRARRISGINHFVLPHSPGETSLRYGNVAIARLVDAMFALGCRIDRIEAKVFGGAAVLPITNPESNVGARNVDVALASLRSLGIPLVARRTGGSNGLSVRLLTESGEVLIHRIASSLAHAADLGLPVVRTMAPEGSRFR